MSSYINSYMSFTVVTTIKTDFQIHCSLRIKFIMEYSAHRDMEAKECFQ